MPWVRLDDSFHDHPKLEKLGPSRLPCLGLHMLALSWTGHWLTDGFIPSDRVRKLGGAAALADRLVAAELWEKAGEDYRIHDYLVYNPSRADVEAERAAAKERMRIRRRNEKGLFAGSSGEVQPKFAGSSPIVRPPRPVPSLPVPSLSEVPANNEAKDAANRRFDKGAEATQRMLRRVYGDPPE